MKITIKATISADKRKVWDYYTDPEHIVHWNFASADWCCPRAENDLRVGGKYKARMEAKDKSFGFDFEAVYNELVEGEKFTYTMEDGREVNVSLEDLNGNTGIRVVFDAEKQNSEEKQKSGWQSILNNFKYYVENNIQKITPNLWFNGNAEGAVDFYVSAFPKTSIIVTSYYPKSKDHGLADFQLNMAGKALTVDFEIMGFRFVAINAGPEFTPNPSISSFITLDSKAEMNTLWKKLADGGSELMALSMYPFSEYYGWVQDKYGVSWQLILNNPEGDWRPRVMPSLLFTQDKNGRAEEAIQFYSSVFTAFKPGQLVRRTEDDPMAKAGTLSFGDFAVGNTWIAAMDGGTGHDYTFNEGVSLLISCKDQDEIDYYWQKLTENGGEESVCGWLKDKFGVSWQVAPEGMEELMKKPEAFKTMMKQTKIVIADY